MKMTLAKALKYRKRVIERIASLTTKIQAGNSYIEGNKAEIDVPRSMIERHYLVKHLLDVRTTISKSNGPIETDILRIPELKAEISMLRGTPILEGVQKSEYREKDTVYVVQVPEKEIDIMIARLEKEIDETQELIDKHNYTTEVEIGVEGFGIW